MSDKNEQLHYSTSCCILLSHVIYKTNINQFSKTRASDFLVLLFYEEKCDKTLVKLKKFCSKYFLTINHQRYIIKVGVSLPT